MKQLYTFLLLTTLCFSFSQTTGTVDFEVNGVGADWTWTADSVDPTFTIVDNPQKSGLNTSDKVVEFVAKTSDMNWALAYSSNIGSFTFDNTNNVVKIMVYKTTTSDFGIKFEGPHPDGTAAVIASEEIKVQNTTVNAWEELTFTFSSSDFGKTFNRIVLIPDFVAPYVTGKDRTADTTVLFDNLQTPLGQTGELFKVSVDMTEFVAENSLTDIAVNIITNNGTNTWAEAGTIDEGNNVYSYTFVDLAANVMAEYKWKVYFGASNEQEILHTKVGGGAIENAIATVIPTNEKLHTDYSSYGNRTIRSDGTGFTGTTYMFNSTRVSGVTYTELTVDTGTAGENIVMDWSINNWDSNHGPGTTDNNDGTYTAIVDPTQAFEYLWYNVTTSTQEGLTSCTSSGAAINSGTDENSGTPYANRVQVAGENKSDEFNVCPANPTDAYVLYVEYSDATDINSWNKVADASTRTSEVVYEHVSTGGNPDGAFKFGGVNADGAGGRAYIFQYLNASFDYKTAVTAKIEFDLKQVALVSTAVHFTYETPSGSVEELNIQNDGLNDTDYTTYTYNATTTAGSGIFRLAFNFAAGAAQDLGGSVLLDNLRVTLLDESGNTLDIVEITDTRFSVYPNPVQNTLNVSAAASVDSVSIFDITGREVLRATPNAAAFSLDVATLNKGLYLVSLKAGDQEMTTKLVK